MGTLHEVVLNAASDSFLDHKGAQRKGRAPFFVERSTAGVAEAIKAGRLKPTGVKKLQARNEPAKEPVKKHRGTKAQSNNQENLNAESND